MDDHVAMQVVREVKLFSTARMGANLGPSFPVHEVDVILQGVKVRIGRFNFISITKWKSQIQFEKNPAVYLKAADGYIDLTAALIRTVKHFEHPVCLDNWASPVSLGPNVHNEKQLKCISAVGSFKFLCPSALGHVAPLTCSDCAAAFGLLPAPNHEHWAAAACHQDLQTNM